MVDWEEEGERQMFVTQSSILYEEIRKRPSLVCDEGCLERMEISVRAKTRPPPTILGDAILRVEEGESFQLTCVLFHGFERTTDQRSHLNFMYNRGTIQEEDLSLGRVIERKGDDIAREATLHISTAELSDSGSYQCRLGTSGNFSVPTKVEVFQVFVGGKSKRDFHGMNSREQIGWFKELEVTDQVNIVDEFDLKANMIVTLYNSGLTDARRLHILRSEPTIRNMYTSGLLGDDWCRNIPNNTCETASENMTKTIDDIISTLLENTNKTISGFGSGIIEPVYTAPSDIVRTEKEYNILSKDYPNQLATGLQDLKATLELSDVFRSHQINKMNNFVTGVRSFAEKVESGDGVNIASGVLDLLGSLAGFAGPYGLGVTAVSGLANNILGAFGPDTMQAVIGKMITTQTVQIERMLSTQSAETRAQMHAGFENLIREMDVNTQKIVDNSDKNTKEILNHVTEELKQNKLLLDQQAHTAFITLAQACQNDFEIKELALKAAIQKGEIQSAQTLQAEIGMADSVKAMTKLRSYAAIFCTSPSTVKLCHGFLFTLTSLSILRDTLYGHYFAFVKQSKASDSDVVARGIYDSLTKRKQWDKTFFTNVLMTSGSTSKGCHTACSIHRISNPHYNQYDYDYQSDLSQARVNLMFDYLKSLGGPHESSFNSSQCQECFTEQECLHQQAIRSDSGTCKIWSSWSRYDIEDCTQTNVKNTIGFTLSDNCEVIRTRNRTCEPEVGGCSGMGNTTDEHRCIAYRHCPRINGEDYKIVTSSRTVQISGGQGRVHVFAVGGGGGASGSGGGSGFHNATTVTLAKGDFLDVTIGTGGKEHLGTESKRDTFTHGNNGGDTIVSFKGKILLKAAGGQAGACCNHKSIGQGLHVRNVARGGAGWSGGGNQGLMGSEGSEGGKGGRNGNKSRLIDYTITGEENEMVSAEGLQELLWLLFPSVKPVDDKRTWLGQIIPTPNRWLDGGSGQFRSLPSNLPRSLSMEAGEGGKGTKWSGWAGFRQHWQYPSIERARGGGGGGVLLSGSGLKGFGKGMRPNNGPGATGFGAGGGAEAGDGLDGVVIIYT